MKVSAIKKILGSLHSSTQKHEFLFDDFVKLL